MTNDGITHLPAQPALRNRRQPHRETIPHDNDASKGHNDDKSRKTRHPHGDASKLTQFLLVMNLAAMAFIGYKGVPDDFAEWLLGNPDPIENEFRPARRALSSDQTAFIKSPSSPPLENGSGTDSGSAQQRDFLALGEKYGTGKVAANALLPKCLEEGNCQSPKMKNEQCRSFGHFYNSLYQQRLGPYSTDDTKPFQFLEIGFYYGAGFETYAEFFPNAESHSMEISCLPKGPRKEGKWPFGNFAEKNHRYQELMDTNRLHCGDASDVKWLNDVWTNKMKRSDSPPLKVVVDDGAHVAKHMAATIFFWFPRIEPRGMLIVEGIQPNLESNAFRTQFLPQIMSDLHFCGDPEFPDDPCFPTLQPLLASVHCEMHICIFERNDKPAVELDLDLSKAPDNALDATKCDSLKSY